MGLTSLQVCMDSSDWLQGSMHEENNEMDSPSVTDMLTNTMPQAIMDQRRLRPPHDQALNCPRCDSTHTKFCYYNNYSLSQPRYFCKTCRRYWTKGGTLRNIPVGGGCRKNKKITPIKKTNINQNINDHRSNPGSSLSQNPVNFRVQEINNMFLGGQGSGFGGFSLLGSQETNSILPINFMESSRSNLGNMVNGIGSNFNGNFSSSFGVSYDGGVENHNRLVFPYEGVNEEMSYQNGIDVKPSTKLLSLDHHNWQDHHQGCLDGGKDYSIGYHLNGLGSWNGMMNNGF